ncbi:MAG: DUF3857 and transglutaminase domain-containing protein [Rikenellaceae bacterium]|nr:DUF3857 and transglutaminase domain-containing protein [Rikenellaceae bacterium]
MKRLLTLLCVAVFAISGVQAQEWLQDYKNQAARAGKQYTSAQSVCLYDGTRVKVADTGSGQFEIRKTILIGDDRGAMSNRIIKYDYDPLTAFAEFTEVTIYRADGSVENIDTATAVDYAAPARQIYWGARQIMIEVGRLYPGDVLDYRISKRGFTYALLGDAVLMADDEERFIPPMRGEFYDIVPFWVSVPTLHKSYVVEVPAHKPVQYEFYQGECRSSIRIENGSKILSFSKDYILPTVRENSMVDLYDAAPKLMMSSTPEWRDKSLWFHGVNEDYGSFEAYAPAQKKVDQIIKGAKDDMDKIARLTHWVADNMRYSGISMGKGEGYTLHNTKMNFDDRCGVCKDKAALLISMLRMAGFEAYPAMTMAGSRIESIAADHFNHCVTVVKLSNGTYMPLDPTWVPFCRELWSSAEQQQNYLPGIPEGSDLCLTPISAPENHYLRMNIRSTIDAEGTLRGTLTVSAEGQTDKVARAPFTTGLKSQIRTRVEAELLKVSPRARLVKYTTVKNPDQYQNGPFNITMTFEIPDYATVADGVIMCQPMIMSGLYSQVRTFSRFDTSIEERKYGFKDSCSRLLELTETITAPKGYTLSGGAIEGSYEGEAASCSVSIEAQGSAAAISNTLRMGKRVYEAEDWGDVRKSLQTYYSANQTLIFTK